MKSHAIRPLIRTIGLCVVACSAVALSACGESTPSAVLNEKTRAGAEQSISPTAALPRASGARQYDSGVPPENEQRGLKVGTAVQGAGGQDAQRDKEKKDQGRLDEEQARKNADLERAQKPDARSSSP